MILGLFPIYGWVEIPVCRRWHAVDKKFIKVPSNVTKQLQPMQIRIAVVALLVACIDRCASHIQTRKARNPIS